MALMHKKTWRVGPLAYCQQSCYNGSTKWGDLLLRDRLAAAKNLFRKDLKGHFGCVNAIEFSHCGGDLIASGGDDRRVLVWNTEKCIANCCVPTPMNGQHHSNIFCLAFDNCNRRLYSGGNDEQVVVHDIETKQTVDVFLHDEAVYGISVDPINDNVFASACDDGKVVLCDIRSAPSEDPFCIASCRSPMHSVTYNPVEPRLLATANAKEGLALWDVRYPRSALLRYGGKNPAQSCMSVRINRSGNTVIALRRRLPPVMYNIHETNAVCQFDHNGYYNSCTMKSCCFAGDNDQYILSGSDDFSLYMWKLPQPGTEVKWMSEAHMVLKGHRSIANQVRFNPDNHLIISSGVEKVIKMWSPFPVPYCQGDLGDGEFDYSERPVYTHEEYINLVLRSGQVMSHDYSNQSTEEDPRMMAFFDSLVQRELEGWSTDDSVHDSEGAGNYQPFVVRGSNTSDGSNSDTLSNHSLHSGDEEGGLSPFTMAFAIAMARRARQTEDGDDGDGDTDRPDDILDMRNSFMERLDELNNSNGSGEGESSSSSTLPGQRPNSARKSITELINQKRKEYLSKAKTDKIPTKKKTSKTKQLKKKSATHTEGTSSTSSSSSSTSSSSDSCDDSGDGSDKAVSGKTRKKLSKDREKGEKRKIDQSSDENQAAEIRSNAESVMKELAVERNRMKSRMKRLKAIRSRAILDLSDSSDSDRDASTSQNKYALSMNHGNKEQGDRSGNASTCSATSVNADCRNEYEIKCRLEEDSNMPHNAAAEADCTLQNKGLEDNNSNFYKGNTIGKGVQNGNVPNGASDTLNDGATSHLNHQKAPRSTLCSKDADNCVANSVNGHTSSVSEHCTPLNGHANLVNGHGSTVSNGASTSSGDAVNVDSQPIWTEFKRFRDRVEKAHRQYRRSSSHRENSTCSSGEEG